MNPRQLQAAEKEFTKAYQVGIVYWLYGKHGGAPQNERDDLLQCLSISLWKACRNRQTNPKLQGYSLATIFNNQARSDRHTRYRKESQKFGIKTRDVGKPESEALRQVHEVSINVEDDDEDNPSYQIPAKSDPLHDVETQTQWEALTDKQRAFVQMKVEGCTLHDIADKLQMSNSALGFLVVDLKRIYGVESVKIQRV